MCCGYEVRMRHDTDVLCVVYYTNISWLILCTHFDEFHSLFRGKYQLEVMACSNINVLLAFEDETIIDKHKHLVNYTTNKVGGKADFPHTINADVINCPLCQLRRLLIVQIYAPLEHTTFNRTLYVFTCINPNCWNQKESWTCIRIQTLESLATQVKETQGAIGWCQDEDDWGDESNANCNEENGNLLYNNAERVSDEEDESYSFEETVRAGFENISIDDKNANAAAKDVAEGRLQSPTASAEIEIDESEVVTIDTPVRPQNDIIALLHESASLPKDFTAHRGEKQIEFISYFLNVAEEQQHSQTATISDRHVRELLQEYQKNNEDYNVKSDAAGCAHNAGGGGEATMENYEKSAPAHGDKMFHYFLMKIHENPGQILRYSRGSTPLLINPLQDIPRKCIYCQSEMVFEFQILPTIIPTLKLLGDDLSANASMEFGNILIFTCRKSCWANDTTLRQEPVVLQQENL